LLRPRVEEALRGWGWIEPDWPAPPGVCAISTTRQGGFSEGSFGSLNLAEHVGDRPEHVRSNRARLRSVLELASEPLWLRQVHGPRVFPASRWIPCCEADGACTEHRGVVCAVQTADCLPVLMCDQEGTTIAVAHAGWRGLAAGILEATVERMALAGSNLLAWLGPAIGAGAYEVGPEVRQAFLDADPGAEGDFRRRAAQRWSADLCGLARRRLAACGVGRIYGGHWCTYSDPLRFFSYRRDGITGRMATLIWLS
jgi:YfiH family protein